MHFSLFENSLITSSGTDRMWRLKVAIPARVLILDRVVTSDQASRGIGERRARFFVNFTAVPAPPGKNEFCSACITGLLDRTKIVNLWMFLKFAYRRSTFLNISRCFYIVPLS